MFAAAGVESGDATNPPRTASRSARSARQESGEAAVRSVGVTAGVGRERNRDEQGAPGPSSRLRGPYAASSSVIASRSKRAPGKFPQRRTLPLFTM